MKDCYGSFLSLVCNLQRTCTPFSCGFCRTCPAITSQSARSAISNRVERFDRRPIEPFELFTSEFGQNLCQDSGKFSKFFRKSWSSKTSQHFLECSAKSREKIIKIWPKFCENCRKTLIFCRNSNKNSKTFDEFLRVFWIRSGAKVCESCTSWKN